MSSIMGRNNGDTGDEMQRTKLLCDKLDKNNVQENQHKWETVTVVNMLKNGTTYHAYKAGKIILEPYLKITYQI